MKRDIRGKDLQFDHRENARLTKVEWGISERTGLLRRLRKTITVDRRADAIMPTKLKPQVFGTSQPSHPCNVIGGGSTSLQQDAGLFKPLPQDPLERGQTGQGPKATLKGAFAHARVASESTDCVRIVKVGQDVIEDRRQPIGLSPQWHGTLDKLGLPSLAMAIHHQTTRHGIGKISPEIRTDDMQAKIDAR